MALPMLKPERRQSPRMTLEALDYISLDPGNGGIVLNVSDGGLCFHAVAPVQGTGTIRFWFSAEGRRIEADGELVWTDATRKTGGLRFTAVPAKAREQMRIWMVQLTAQRKSVEPVAAPHALPGFSSSRPSTNPEPDECAPPDVLSPKEKPPTLSGGFYRGLAAGIVISAFVAGAGLFHAYRRQFGESLIRLGERFGAKQQLQAVAPAPAPIPVQLPMAAPKPKTVSPAPAPIPAPRPEKVLAQAPTKAVKPQQTKLEPEAPAAAISSTPPTTSLPTTVVAPDLNHTPGNLGEVPKLESAEHPSGEAKVVKLEARNHPSGNAEDIGVLNSGVPLGKYFEVGRFKDGFSAEKETEALAQVGFHSVVIHKSLLWMNSYQVLAGPYSNGDEAEVARKDLKSRGFKPRSLARKSRHFPLRIPSGDLDFIVSWESYSPDATVRFVKGDWVVAAAQGRWVKRHVQSKYDAIMYQTNGRARRLIEIEFRGTNQVVVLLTDSSNHPLVF